MKRVAGLGSAGGDFLDTSGDPVTNFRFYVKETIVVTAAPTPGPTPGPTPAPTFNTPCEAVPGESRPRPRPPRGWQGMQGRNAGVQLGTGTESGPGQRLPLLICNFMIMPTATP